MAVAETEHVGRAAERLHISQSPLSRQIRQLEVQLGYALFLREGRRIKLAPAGRRLLARGARASSRAPTRSSAMRAMPGARGPPSVAVGFVGSYALLATGVLPGRAAHAARAIHADVEIRLRHANTPTQLALVRAGELDLALVHAPPRERDLRVHLLVRAGDSGSAVPRRGPLARKTLVAAALADGPMPWIAGAFGRAGARERWLSRRARPPGFARRASRSRWPTSRARSRSSTRGWASRSCRPRKAMPRSAGVDAAAAAVARGDRRAVGRRATLHADAARRRAGSLLDRVIAGARERGLECRDQLVDLDRLGQVAEEAGREAELAVAAAEAAAVSAITGMRAVSGDLASSRSASRPLMPGRLMSMRIAAGWRARAIAIPISAVGAVAS